MLTTSTVKANIIPREQHNISRENISKSALKVLYRLHDAGFGAYLVGGGVRDLLLGKHPKDFDVATDATPEQVRQLFRNSRIIGRRFRLVHVRYGREIIEVATFRGSALDDPNSVQSEHGMILRDNVYGSMSDDALRRDFTVNALYYNIADFSVVDYCNGMQDMIDHTIRIIGDPAERYREDPVRMLRALRLAAKLDFHINPQASKVIKDMAPLLHHVAPARRFDELVKIIMGGAVQQTFTLLHEYQVFEHLFPTTNSIMWQEPMYQQFIDVALAETDQRIAEGKTINPAFLLAVLLWAPLQDKMRELQADGLNVFQALAAAESVVIKAQQQVMSLPRRLVLMIREIWMLQLHLPQTRRNRIMRTLHHARFRAAYDFLLLRNKAGESLQPLCDWWTEFQDASTADQRRMIKTRQSKKEK